MFASVADPAGAVLPEPAVRRQATLGAAFERSGHGLHTGRRVTARVMPAPADHGIVFRRILPGGRTSDVPALWRFREPQPLCSALRRDGVLVRTVEHLLAALSALRIDNALAEIDAEELPIFDGSALRWCEGIARAGRVEQEAPCRVVRVLRTVTVVDGARSLTVEPGAGLSIEAHIALAYVGAMDWSGAITPDRFLRDLAPARSFGRFFRAMAGRAYGFAARKPLLRGCTPRSAALLIRDRVIGGMRLPDEFVRHRVLDVIGDFALVGHPIEGRITAAHTCHDLNHALVAALMRDPDAWQRV